MSVKKTEVEVKLADEMTAPPPAAAPAVAAPINDGPQPIVPEADPTLADVMLVLQNIAASLAMLVVAEQKEAKTEEPVETEAPPATEEPAPATEEPPAEPKKEKEPGVGDSEPAVLPFYSQSLAANQTAAGLDDLFAKMKGKRG